MFIRLLCAYMITKYVCKISFCNFKILLRKLKKKNLRGYFFAAPCRYVILVCAHLFVIPEAQSGTIFVFVVLLFITGYV